MYCGAAAYCCGAAYAVVIGAAYEVVIGAAYDVVIGACWYMVVGVSIGNNGATSNATSSSAGATGADFLDFLALFAFLPQHMKANAHKQIKSPPTTRPRPNINFQSIPFLGTLSAATFSTRVVVAHS